MTTTDTMTDALIPTGFTQNRNTDIDVIDAYANHLRASGRREATIRLRCSHVHRIAVRHPGLLDVTGQQLEQALAHAARRGLKPETLKSMRSSAQSFYGWARRSGLLQADPAADLRSIRVPSSVARCCPDSAVRAALTAATLPERAMILLGRYAGLRLTEIATLHTTHLLTGGVLLITGKGGQQRVVPIPYQLAHLLEALERVQGPGWYFPGRFTGHLHPQSVHKIIQRRLGWNPHSLRHAAATSAYRATRNLRAVQAFLGHSSIATTQRYLGVDMDEVRAVAEATVIDAA